MRFVTLDIESFFSQEYTFSRLTTEEYTRDKRFSAHGAAIKWSASHESKWYPERQLRQVLRDEDWSDVCLISHHAQWDHLALNHWYGVRPAINACTLSMARLLLGNHLGVSLDAVRSYYGIPPKITPYKEFIGKHWDEMTPEVQQKVADGACDETESIWKIFCIMLKEFPREELEVISHTIKMFSEPCLQANVELLAQIWEKEDREKRARLADLNVADADLQSADKFADLLRAEGVEPETKPGKAAKDGTPRRIYCFAKTDPFMEGLLEDEDDRVRTLAEARVGAKSTALQTRAETLGTMANRGPLCVYLRMYGAHTTRWSGGDGANWQNFKRVDRRNRGASIREAILPPEGFHLVDPDLSQVEARVLAYLAGQEDSLEEFRRGEDPYLKLATAAYGYEVTKEMPEQRGTGKQLRLSCGFQAGAKTIQRTARLGTYGPPVRIDLDTALRWRDIYREQNPRVVDYWKTAGRMIARVAGGEPLQWGPFTIRDQKVFLPNGLRINYTGVEYHKDEETGESNWRVPKRRGKSIGWSKLYPGKLTENVVQFAARCIASQAFIRIARLGYKIVNTEHDKHWILIPKDGQEAHHVQVIRGEMIREPAWLPGIPLDCECKVPA